MFRLNPKEQRCFADRNPAEPVDERYGIARVEPRKFGEVAGKQRARHWLVRFVVETFKLAVALSGADDALELDECANFARCDIVRRNGDGRLDELDCPAHLANRRTRAG